MLVSATRRASRTSRVRSAGDAAACTRVRPIASIETWVPVAGGLLNPLNGSSAAAAAVRCCTASLKTRSAWRSTGNPLGLPACCHPCTVSRIARISSVSVSR